MEEQQGRVLAVDDDPAVLRAVTEVLKQDGHEVLSLKDPVEAMGLAEDRSIDLVLTDIRMPNLSGMELLKAFKAAQPDVEVLMMTAYATVDTAVAAVKAGAYDYLTKPFERIDDLSRAVANALEHRRLKKRAEALEAELGARDSFEGMLGQSPQMHGVFKLVETVSPTTATVLVQGETGTGKELIARAIHFRSPRKGKPFVSVNCSALTDTLLESELFGHVKGAFTGALSQKKGLFEAAHGGSIFLDEIGDIPPATQVRLLRVLQEGEIKRVGGTESIPVDVRVIAATHVDLAKAKAEGRFREDLYYRLNVITLHLPPLRDRPQDIPLLAQHFLKVYARRLGRSVSAFTGEALKALTLHRWPGNVRELEHAIERAVVLTPGEMLEAEALPDEVKRGAATGKGPELDPTSLNHLPFAQAKELALRAFERRYLTGALAKSGNNVSAAALAAGMDRSNFRRLLKQHEIGGRRAGSANGGAGEDPEGPIGPEPGAE